MPLPYQDPSREDVLNLYGGEFSPFYQKHISGRLNQIQGVADLYQQGEQTKLNHDQIMNPLIQEGQRLGNTGQRENNKRLERENKFGDETFDQKLKDYFAQSKVTAQKQHFDELDQLGRTYGVIAAQVKDIQDPILRNLKARQLFEKSGLKDHYDPSIDAQHYERIAGDILTMNSKAQQALQTQEMKNTGAAELLKQKLASQERIAKLQATVRKQIADVNKDKSEKTPTKYEGLSAFYARKAVEAMNSGDETTAEFYQNTSQSLLRVAHELALAATLGSQTGKVDIGGVTDLPTKPQPSTPQLNLPTPQAAPAPSKPASAVPGVADRPIRQKLQQQGQPYEPDKYEYAIDADGDVVRRLKRK